MLQMFLVRGSPNASLSDSNDPVGIFQKRWKYVSPHRAPVSLILLLVFADGCSLPTVVLSLVPLI